MSPESSLAAVPKPAPMGAGADTQVTLLDGGAEAYPRMLEAIESATRRVHLEVYTFEREGVGSSFVAALTAAAQRGVEVKVIVDGWGSMGESGPLRATLRAAGARAHIYNPLTSIFTGRAWRNHRKILLVDDQVAFIGGINIGDDYLGADDEPGWADLVLELRGEICTQLGAKLQAGNVDLSSGPVRILLSGFGGGRRLRKRYLRALKQAKQQVVLAHAYFLPDRGFMRALQQTAKRGVSVQLLLAGRSDVAFARAATMRLYRYFLKGGVRIHELTGSTLHAKAAVVDGKRLLMGSFNLDPLSMVNLETLVDVEDEGVAAQATAWLDKQLKGARPISLADCSRTGLQAWALDILGLTGARLAEFFAHFIGRKRRR
ncbi:MAG TPA: phosphatidylserine/phosphatidylglycerophosphate/cardiolipin synthase family protein [Hyalangium sp.]|nr:phosphatidylserine/phosphatidylglycerophosphate/cardiolipin synthase family protein [Hyalangium sp.]